MKTIAIYRPTGEVFARHTLAPYYPQEGDAENAEAVFYAAQGDHIAGFEKAAWAFVESFLEGYIDPATGEFRPFPEKPSAVHVWDWMTRSWVASTDKAAAAATQRIEDARIARTVAPIAYDGKLLDGDATAQENVKSKLAELGEREALDNLCPPELCFWRDAHNETHLWPGHAEYRAWLGGFTIALAQRGTESYAWAWGQKALRDAAVAAGDIAALQALPNE